MSDQLSRSGTFKNIQQFGRGVKRTLTNLSAGLSDGARRKRDKVRDTAGRFKETFRRHPRNHRCSDEPYSTGSRLTTRNMPPQQPLLYGGTTTISTCEKPQFSYGPVVGMNGPPLPLQQASMSTQDHDMLPFTQSFQAPGNNTAPLLDPILSSQPQSEYLTQEVFAAITNAQPPMPQSNVPAAYYNPQRISRIEGSIRDCDVAFQNQAFSGSPSSGHAPSVLTGTTAAKNPQPTVVIPQPSMDHDDEDDQLNIVTSPSARSGTQTHRCPYESCTSDKEYEMNRLKEHIRRAHIRPFACKDCDYRQGDTHQIQRHRATHHRGLPVDLIGETSITLDWKKHTYLKSRSLSYPAVKRICQAQSVSELESISPSLAVRSPSSAVQSPADSSNRTLLRVRTDQLAPASCPTSPTNSGASDGPVLDAVVNHLRTIGIGGRGTETPLEARNQEQDRIREFFDDLYQKVKFRVYGEDPVGRPLTAPPQGQAPVQPWNEDNVFDVQMRHKTPSLASCSVGTVSDMHVDATAAFAPQYPAMDGFLEPNSAPTVQGDGVFLKPSEQDVHPQQYVSLGQVQLTVFDEPHRL